MREKTNKIQYYLMKYRYYILNRLQFLIALISLLTVI